VALATGYTLAPHLTLDGSAALKHAGRWTVTNAGDSQVFAELQLVCGRLT
jgi:hypothetical protein